MEPLPAGRVVCPRCGYDNSIPHDEGLYLKEGSVLNGKYLVGKALGQGGFGITYLGIDLGLKSKVAIKEYFPREACSRIRNTNYVRLTSRDGQEAANFRSGVDEFKREAQTLAKFKNSPSIARVIEFFEENNTAYIVMDFIEGTGLNEEIRSKGRIPWKRMISLVLPLLPEIDRLHKENLIHRDIKPCGPG